MGNTQPTNKTGRKVVQQKLENAKKTNILSLCEHKLESLPLSIFQITSLKTLDVSNNELTSLTSSSSFNNNNNSSATTSIKNIDTFQQLKSLNCENNNLGPGSLESITNLSKLQILKASNNMLGFSSIPNKKGGKFQKKNKNITTNTMPSLPTKLPSSLKQITLNKNGFEGGIPPSILSSSLLSLEKLDLSSNSINLVPKEISNLQNLSDLKLDENFITALPEDMGMLRKLKTLSLKHNQISAKKGVQTLPSELFTDTILASLDLYGNPITSTQINDFLGFDKFLERRQKVKTKDLYGGAMTNLDVCGLE